MNLTYEILENGYRILNNNEVWLEQIEPYIPHPSKTYEENAQIQIAELIKSREEAEEKQATLEDLANDITDIQVALAELGEIIAGGAE